MGQFIVFDFLDKKGQILSSTRFFITYITSKYKDILKLFKNVNKKQENFRCCSIIGKEIFAEKQFSFKMPNFSISEYVMT